MSALQQVPDLNRCPECGEPIEITATVWLKIDGDGRFVPGFDTDFTSEASRFYCPNDHKLDDWAARNDLYDRLREWIEPRLRPTNEGTPCPSST
jgi:hypothetical protein